MPTSPQPAPAAPPRAGEPTINLLDDPPPLLQDPRHDLYGLLHSARERLCLAQMRVGGTSASADDHRTKLDEAVSHIDAVGAARCPQWSRFDRNHEIPLRTAPGFAGQPDAARPWSELRESGLLWLINRVVFHPRGFALAVHARGTEAVGWSVLGDGSEVWAFDEEADDGRFAAAEATLAQLRHPASVAVDDDKPWPTWGTFSCGDCGMVKYNRGLRGGIARAFADHLVATHADHAADLLAERFMVDHAGPNLAAETLVERPDPTRVTTDGKRRRVPSKNPGAQ